MPGSLLFDVLLEGSHKARHGASSMPSKLLAVSDARANPVQEVLLLPSVCYALALQPVTKGRDREPFNLTSDSGKTTSCTWCSAQGVWQPPPYPPKLRLEVIGLPGCIVAVSQRCSAKCGTRRHQSSHRLAVEEHKKKTHDHNTPSCAPNACLFPSFLSHEENTTWLKSGI